eukprot:TRINITY_DN18459_c0_g2_i1.p1 TRINITY_DN18459_c0_g2~~TRINITY_DN18459_c0_g2_i1.p1  ORF type:complete len:581 (+),score=221.24 TRINITY_DN18459_c0_g2_i1:101-1744(+)
MQSSSSLKQRGSLKRGSLHDDDGMLGESFFQDYVPDDLSILTPPQLQAYATLLQEEVGGLKESYLRAHFRVWKHGAKAGLFREEKADGDEGNEAQEEQWTWLMQRTKDLKLVMKCWGVWKKEYTRKQQLIENLVQKKMFEAEIKRVTENKEARKISINDTRNAWQQLSTTGGDMERTTSYSRLMSDNGTNEDVLNEAAAAWSVDVHQFVILWLEAVQDPARALQCAANCTTSLQDGSVLCAILASFPEPCFPTPIGWVPGDAGDPIEALRAFFSTESPPLPAIGWRVEYLDHDDAALTYLCLIQLIGTWMAEALRARGELPAARPRNDIPAELANHLGLTMNSLGIKFGIQSAAGWVQVKEVMRIFAIDQLVKVVKPLLHPVVCGLVLDHATGGLHKMLLDDKGLNDTLTAGPAAGLIAALFHNRAGGAAEMAYAQFEGMVSALGWVREAPPEAVHLAFHVAHCAGHDDDDLTTAHLALNLREFGESLCILAGLFHADGAAPPDGAKGSIRAHVKWFLDGPFAAAVRSELPGVWQQRLQYVPEATAT